MIAGGSDADVYDDILEYDPQAEAIQTKGRMIQVRRFHAISVVQAQDYAPWCQ